MPPTGTASPSPLATSNRTDVQNGLTNADADAFVAGVAREYGLDRGHALDYKGLIGELFEIALEKYIAASAARPSLEERASLWCAATVYCASRPSAFRMTAGEENDGRVVPRTDADFRSFVAEVDREYAVTNPRYDYKENWSDLLSAACDEYADRAGIGRPLPPGIDASILRAVDAWMIQRSAAE